MFKPKRPAAATPAKPEPLRGAAALQALKDAGQPLCLERYNAWIVSMRKPPEPAPFAMMGEEQPLYTSDASRHWTGSHREVTTGQNRFATEGTTTGGAAGAIVGGLLAGPVGALAGYAASKKTTESITTQMSAQRVSNIPVYSVSVGKLYITTQRIVFIAETSALTLAHQQLLSVRVSIDDRPLQYSAGARVGGDCLYVEYPNVPEGHYFTVPNGYALNHALQQAGHPIPSLSQP